MAVRSLRRFRLGHLSFALALGLLLAGCSSGGGGGGNSGTSSSSSSGSSSGSLPTASVRDAAISRPLQGTGTVEFQVALSAQANGQVDVDYATSDGTATSPGDYTATSGTLSFSAGETVKTVPVTVNSGSTHAYSNQTFVLTLSNVSANAMLGTSQATGTIVNRQLNDTGIVECATEAQSGLACPQALYPSQDADEGRDALAGGSKLTKTGGSTNPNQGFDFSKLDAADGHELPQSSGTWGCTRDNATGLWWEVKKSSGAKSSGNTYTWYNPDSKTNGGGAGTPNGGVCTGSSCDTQSYVAYVNGLNSGQGLCGKSDWRLPTATEFRDILDLSVRDGSPPLDTGYFPNMVTTDDYWWTADPIALQPGLARAVSFKYDSTGGVTPVYVGAPFGLTKSAAAHVMLVRKEP